VPRKLPRPPRRGNRRRLPLAERRGGRAAAAALPGLHSAAVPARAHLPSLSRPRGLEWAPAPDRGTLVSHTVVTTTTYADFESPYAIAVVELEPGLRVLANLEPPEAAVAGSPVRVREVTRDGRSLPIFAPDPPRGELP
jgi:uncharacterized OB-fold protein